VTVTPIPSKADALNDALVAFTGAIGEAVTGICSYGLTYGDTYVPFAPDDIDQTCTDVEEAMCSQVWVRLISASPSPGAVEAWTGDCAIEMSMQLEVGVVRCVGIPEGGEAPAATDALIAAIQANDDMMAIHCAAMATEVWSSITTGTWQPHGPIGGQYGGTWDFTVTI
jgi:hypothetical protein